MATSPSVTYLCECQKRFPLSELYFCEQCSKVLCRLCLAEEIDSYYCPHCLENMPSSEAMLYLNKCSKCFECPSCFNTLSPVVSSDQRYYFTCQFCRWDSAILGLVEERPDQLIVKAFSRERDGPHRHEAAKLIEKFRKISSEVQKEKELQARLKRRSTIGLIVASASNRRQPPTGPWKWEDMEAALVQKETQQKSKHVQTIAGQVTDNEKVIQPDDPLDVSNVTTLQQRFTDPACQPSSLSELYPSRKQLLTRRSRRCRVCTRFVVKPEINPCAVPPFKKNNIAMSFIPRVSIVQLPSLNVGQPAALHLSFTNPLDSNVHISFFVDEFADVSVVVPAVPSYLGALNDLLEVNELWASEETPEGIEPDDPKYVVQRQFNRVVFNFQITPSRETSDVEVTIGWRLKYQNAMNQEQTVTVQTVLSLGRVSP
eukprot:GILK01006711.1.p1 GENE.GILK01006711.1~~GILK01006711.1.p1  ORF type:complete len:469 (+),score=68.02 GILK01006711.1:122-1408(+)